MTTRTTGAWCALLLTGCWSVIPGYDPVGKGITQRGRDRDERTIAFFYTWSDVPTSTSTWSPFAAVANGLVSAALLPLSLVLVPVRGVTSDPPPDDEAELELDPGDDDDG